MHSPELIRLLMQRLEIKEDITAMYVAKICNIAQEYGLGGALVNASDYENAIGIYIQTYMGYVQYSLSTGKLVSSEKRWQAISTQEGLEKWLLHFI